MVYSAPGPVTRTPPPLRSDWVIGKVLLSFFSSTAPSSDIFSTTAASPFFVPRLAVGVAPCAGPVGSGASPLVSLVASNADGGPENPPPEVVDRLLLSLK